MKQSRRALRMERHHKRNSRIPGLNLVSLMDIFTILVFFLLVNSSDGEVLPSTRSVTLPESLSEQKPRQNVVVMVTGKDILVQGIRVASIEEAKSSRGRIDAVKSALETQLKRLVLPDSTQAESVLEVTIMGNKDIPYALLKKVMVSCTEAGYERISLAVLQKSAVES
jgi:biopolymer transport protein ExbD